MVDKKAQGISISFIVVAAIAALVLVLVIAFATGGLGKFFGSIYTVSDAGNSNSAIQSAQIKCQGYCNDAQIGSYGAWENSNYCKKVFRIDTNGDGNISSDEKYNCYAALIGVDCTLNKADAYGAAINCGPSECKTGCPGTGCVENITMGYDECMAAGYTWEQLTTP